MTSWRPDAHPATKRYKNRKKALRQQRQAGSITDTEHAELMAAARLRCLRERSSGARIGPPTAWDIGLEYLAVHGEGSLGAPIDHTVQGGCDAHCIGAEHPKCRCPCKGANHGAAHWAQRQAAGLCRCGRDLEPGQTMCSICASAMAGS